MRRSYFRLVFFLLSLGLAWNIYGACRELYNVAWGTGAWLGEFSLTWFILFFAFVAFCLVLFLGVSAALWKPNFFAPFSEKFILLRNKIGIARWLAALLIFIFPVYFLQYTSGGVIFQGTYMRSLIWVVVTLFFASVITKDNFIIGWKEFLSALLLVSSEFIIAVEFVDVNNYPFSLGWSEGNRLWDYSALFGRSLYLYPADKEIPVLLDFGRQFVGGLPFLFPNITLGVERFWVALTFILPYLALGLAAFRASAKDKTQWLLATLWVFLFLKQGPIHPPLVLSAALVALAWRAPLWFAIPLVMGAGYFAENSRATWIFAPAIWIVMLEFVGAYFSEQKKIRTIWTRSITLGIAGIFGGFLFPMFIRPALLALFQSGAAAAAAAPVNAASSFSMLDMIVALMTTQPLLWYRLLPNSTYKNGILIALVIATTPLIAILLRLLIKKVWQITRLQKLALLLPLIIFLAIGLIASAKIGGGGDLHNMDMFLISLTFTAALAWYNGGREWILNGGAIPTAFKIIIALFLIIPALSSLREMYPYNLGEEAPRLVKLADAPDEKSLGMLPTRQTVDDALQTIQDEVALAQQKGDVLFLDQRQLLTFGYIKNVPLVAEYEKKFLMNEALSSNAAYFAPFYKDLAAQRFTLIVSEPLRQNNQSGDFQFGEENNAWVKWVSTPILCYYEEITTLKEVGVQLLAPIANPTDCSSQIPQGILP
ncbi:MAG: hypothetical protein PHQ36_04460 [Anaerolineales bacterium]|nr:hypothetical protein [Anaerolineales bacterium]